MELTIALIISIIGCTISVISFALTRKDKSNKDTETESYKFGKLDMQLENIMEKLTKIEDKLDYYDKDVDERISKAIENHIAIYHKKI